MTITAAHALYLSVAFTLLAPAAPAGSADQRVSDRTRDVYVSALDGKGAPVKGLDASAFAVREDGAAREVLKAEPATAPMDIALLVDDSQAATGMIQPLREALTTFVDKLQGKAQIALITFGERPTTVVEYTSNAELLKRGIGRVFPRTSAGPYLLEAIVDASRGLQRRETSRPVMVVITVEGIEFSNQYHQTVLEHLERSGAQLHVLAVGSPSGSLSDEMRNRNMVIAEGTERTGGRREQVLAESALPEKMAGLAQELLDQYVVTYGRPETLIPPERIEVSSTRPGVTVRARTRVAK
jgi:VWFA-related protein